MTIDKWVIWGANGFIGRHALHFLSARYPCIQVLREKDFSLCVIDEHGNRSIFEDSEAGYMQIISAYKPRYLLNCAAIASVEECAKNPSAARQSNVELPSILATICRKKNLKFIHISTDAVFGQAGRLFEENQTPAPVSTYAKTKYEAESLVSQLNLNALILRTRPLGESTRRTTLLDFLIDNLLDGNQIEGHTNVYFTPIFIIDFLVSLEKLAVSECTGVWHVTGSERLSKFDVANFVAEALNINRNLVVPSEFKNNHSSTARNLDTSLSNHKYTDIFGQVPSVRNAIEGLSTRL